MKKILFIIPSIPYPLTSGGNQAFFNMVDYIRQYMSVSVLFSVWTNEEKERVQDLKSLWHDVELFVFARNKEVKSEESLPVRYPLYYNLLRRVKASLERKMRRQLLLPYDAGIIKYEQDLVRERSVLYHSVFKELDNEYVEYVINTANSGFDIIQVEFYELIALGYVLPQNVHTIFVHHELRYIRNENEMCLFRRRMFGDSMHFLVSKDLEWNTLRKYKSVITLTEVDRQLLTDFMGWEDHVYASPAVVQLKTNSSVAFLPCVENRFTFVGHGGHFPNLDAVMWFCEEIAPILRKREFKFTFQVIGVGYEPYSEKLQMICPEIKCVGFVEKLDVFLQGSIALVPIRIGSGMRMKILDVIGLNVPFIATSKGLEGIDFNSGQECLVADNVVGFADAIIQLSGDSALQNRLVDQAKGKLAELYNPQAMLERRLSIYNSILKENC